MVTEDGPLLELLRELGRRRYEFVAVTPATHIRVLSRPARGAPTLQDIFGWNRAFTADEIDARLLAILKSADAVDWDGAELRSRVRVASLDGCLFLHSSFPTEHHDSVFFGPDTYRFARFIRHRLARMRRPAWVVDMGAGTGAGGIIVSRLTGSCRVTLVDVNPAALRLATINAAYAGVAVETVCARTLPAGADLIIANPPYLMDSAKRTYRDGGALLGGAVALEWAEQAISTMADGGTMLLYTGVAYERGRAPLLDALARACGAARAELSIEELDPDVFGEELDGEGYSQVERLAAVGVVITTASPAAGDHQSEES